MCGCVCEQMNVVPYDSFSGCVPIYLNSFVIIIISVILFWCNENEMKYEIKIDQENSHFPYRTTICTLVFSSLLLLEPKWLANEIMIPCGGKNGVSWLQYSLLHVCSCLTLCLRMDWRTVRCGNVGQNYANKNSNNNNVKKMALMAATPTCLAATMARVANRTSITLSAIQKTVL